MKKTKNSPDKSAVYRSYGFGKIVAPTPTQKSEPKGSKITGKGDLRGGKA